MTTVALLLTASASAAVPPDVVQALQSRADQAYDSASAIAILTPEGREILAFGAATPDSGFELGSITKTFTAALLAERVAAGELSLETTLGTLVPELPERARSITVGQLASHTSGLARDPCNLEVSADPFATFGWDETVEALERCPMGDPVYVYSNFGFGLLGEVLARRAEVPWATLVRERLSNPLGLDATGYPAPDPGRMLPGGWTFDALAGCGALRSTAGDLLDWTIASTTPSELGLGPAFALQRAPRAPAGAGRVGLGWHLREVDGRPLIWHNGGTGAFVSFTGAYDGRVVAVLAASDQSVDSIGFHALAPQLPLDVLRPRAKLPPERLAEYVGRYPLSPSFALEVTAAADHLVVQATGQQAFPVWPDGADHFVLHVVDAAVRFERGRDGAVEALVLEQCGVEQRGQREVPPRGGRRRAR
ncbi:MAG: serine hydrolase [Myxococcota bacterium]